MKSEVQDAHSARQERLSGSLCGNLLGNKLPHENLPAVTAINGSLVEIVVADGVAVILDLEREAIIDRGDNLALPYKYDLDFLDEEDEAAIPAILAAYERAISKVAA